MKEIKELHPGLHGKKVRCKYRVNKSSDWIPIPEGIIYYNSRGWSSKPSYYLAQDIIQAGRPSDFNDLPKDYSKTCCLVAADSLILSDRVIEMYLINTGYVPFL